jgi:nitrous oxidase accessory protein NosD
MRTLLFVALFATTGSAFALSCGDTLTRDTVLDADLHCASGEAALFIARNGVTLDLAGHRISGGSSTAGVALENAHGVTVRGPGRFEGLRVGIEAVRSERLTVSGLEFVGVGDGVRLHNSALSDISGNRFDGVAGHAVAVLALPWSVTEGGRHSIHHNEVSHSEYGVLLVGDDSGGSEVSSNRFEAMGTFAIQVDRRADFNRIEDNQFGVVGVTPISY